MVLLPTTLRLEAADGSGVEEYRIFGDRVEVRRPRCGEENDDPELVGDQVSGGWRRLTPSDLSRHVKDNTVVAHWLKQRLGWRRLLYVCTDPQILEEFEVPANALDRNAA